MLNYEALRRNKVLVAALLVAAALSATEVGRNWRARHVAAQQGSLMITSSGHSIVADLVAHQGTVVLEQISIPMKTKLRLDPGDYQLRIRIPNLPEARFPLTVVRGEETHLQLSRHTPTWAPIELGARDVFELVRFGDREDFLVLGQDSMRRVQGDTGEELWVVNYHALPKLPPRFPGDHAHRIPASFLAVYLPARDLDQDGVADVLLYSENFSAQAFSGKNGKHLWDWRPRNSISARRIRLLKKSAAGNFNDLDGMTDVPNELDFEDPLPLSDSDYFATNENSGADADAMPTIQIDDTWGGPVRVKFFYATHTESVMWRSACVSGAAGDVLWDREVADVPTDRMHFWASRARNIMRYGRQWFSRPADTPSDIVTKGPFYPADFNGDGVTDLFWLEERGRRHSYFVHRSQGELTE